MVTCTNLLGLVKPLSGCEIGYFGYVFDRPFPDPHWPQLHDRIERAAREGES